MRYFPVGLKRHPPIFDYPTIEDYQYKLFLGNRKEVQRFPLEFLKAQHGEYPLPKGGLAAFL